MKLIVGLVMVFGSVAGGYVLSHGQMLALVQPYEMLIIAGAAAGAFVISNPGKIIKAVLANVPALLRGAPYRKRHYLDLLSLLYELFSKSRKQGLMALEADIEDPEQSEIFARYPWVAKDQAVREFITDYLRLMVGGNMNAFEIENLMDLDLETHHHEAEQPGSALNRVADGLPGFGIVAAVLGVVITMGALNEPPEVLGKHIAAALVGTFLGILLAYGLVAPMASALEHRAREQSKFLECIKVCILATLNGYTPQIAVEFGRKVLYSSERPAFEELENHLKENRPA